MPRSPQQWDNACGVSCRPGLTLALVVLFATTVALAQSAQAQTFTLLYSFSGGADGETPYSDLILDAAGNLYGTTYSGGNSGLGTVFELDTNGNETVLHSFTGGADGANPHAGVTMDGAGNIYGTTSSGGAGGGTIFKLSHSGSNWVLSILYSFTGGNDGGTPWAKVIFGLDGSLYGTTAFGGSYGDGTVFKLRPSATFCRSVLCPWTEIVLHSFTGGLDGAWPYATLIKDAAGNLYGTSSVRGAYNGGTVFKIDANGNQTVLYSFEGGHDGLNPDAGLIRDATGNLYGTTYYGGVFDYCWQLIFRHGSCGVVFKLDTIGDETVLYSFEGPGHREGSFPAAALIADQQGYLYGTTAGGGNESFCLELGCGTIFKISTAGVEETLYLFPQEGQSGLFPAAALVRDANGNLYGTASAGGVNNAGTVFKLTP